MFENGDYSKHNPFLVFTPCFILTDVTIILSIHNDFETCVALSQPVRNINMFNVQL